MEEKEEIELSYMAGILDGDGSFSLMKRSPKKELSPLYYPCIQLGSLSKDLTEFFKEKLGGFTGFIRSKICKDGICRRDFYTWKAEKAGPCMNVLKKICSFLVVKKERAEFLMRYVLENPFKRGSNRLSEEVLANRELAYRKMREYNTSTTCSRSFSRKEADSVTEDKRFWSYLAGLLDTDGSFSIKKCQPSRHTITCNYSPVILLSMTDISGLNYIKENCPYGTFQTYMARTCIGGVCSRWCVSSKEESIDLIKKIIPFLRVKKESAKILLNFCENFTPVLKRHDSVPEKELSFRENCYQELIYMNKYGVYKPSLIDLEVQKQDDRAEDESHGDRLSERASEEDATVRTRL